MFSISKTKYFFSQIKLVILAFLLVFAVITTRAQAPNPNFKLGKVEFVPNASIVFEYNSNVFTSADDAQIGEEPNGDLIISPVLRLDALYNGRSMDFDAKYEFGFNKYLSEDSEDYLEQDFGLGLDWRTPSDKFEFGFDVGFLSSQETATHEELSNVDFISERTSFTIGISGLAHVGESLSLGLGIAREVDDFDSSSELKDVLQQDNTEDTLVTLEGKYRLRKKMSLLARYRLVNREFPDANTAQGRSDSINNDFSVGVTWDAAAKLSGEATIGFANKSFDGDFFDSGDGLGGDPNGKRDPGEIAFDDESTFTIGTELTWALRPKSTLNLGISRSIEDTSTLASASVIESAVTIGYEQEIGKRMSGNVSGTFINLEFNDALFDGKVQERTDTNIIFGLGMKYDIRKWAYWSVDYEFQNNSSDFSDREYVVHRLIVGLGTQF